MKWDMLPLSCLRKRLENLDLSRRYLVIPDILNRFCHLVIYTVENIVQQSNDSRLCSWVTFTDALFYRYCVLRGWWSIKDSPRSATNLLIMVWYPRCTLKNKTLSREVLYSYIIFLHNNSYIRSLIFITYVYTHTHMYVYICICI